MKAFIAFLVCLSLCACAPSAKNVSPAYVSPLQYQSFNCNQINLEMQRVTEKVNTLTGQQNSRSTQDGVALGVGIIFWPALFFMIGDDKKEELASLKGQYDALEQAAIQKECKK